jgi:GAF domain-containing protein/two-component sensor histidine kinase/PAS domain-containing protein
MSSALRTTANGVRAHILGLSRRIDTDMGSLALIWFLRFGALLGLGTHFVVNQTRYGEDTLSEVRIALLVFFIYVMAVGVVGAFRLEWFLLRRVKLVQVLIELGLYSWFHTLTGDPRSEIYFLYFLPLFVSVRYVGGQWALAILGAAVVGLCITLYFTAAPLGDYPRAEVYVYRALFMIGATLFYAIRRRTSPLWDAQEESSYLMSVLRPFDDGVFVVDKNGSLLFVNDVLRAKHGPYASGQTCSSYFGCRAQLCSLCPMSGSLKDLDAGERAAAGTFIDQDGHSYQVEVFGRPLPDERGDIVGSIAFVRDISRRKELERRLGSRLEEYARRVQALTSERARWLDTFYAMGQRLSSAGDLQGLMDFVVDETKRRLNSETSSLFLLENERLVRTAIAGVENDWFPDESYGVGEGITGQPLVPHKGTPFGEPVLTNNVDEDPRVVQEHLARYAAKLDTRSVKHLIVVPLNGQTGSFGVLRVVNKLDPGGMLSTRGFGPEDVDFLVTIASMVAVALENAKLLREVTQYLQRTNTLYTVAQRIAQTWDLHELLQTIVEEARSTIPRANKATIHLTEIQTGALRAQAVSEPEDAPSGLPPLRSDQGIAGRAIRDKRVVCVPDTGQDLEFRDRGVAVASLLVAPLIAGDDVIGTLSVDGDQAHAFTADDEQLLAALAAHAAIAIKRAQLFRQEQEKRYLADTLREVSEVVNRTLDLEGVLQCTLDQLRRVVPYDSSSIQVVEDGQLKIIACDGFDDPDEVKQLAFPTDDPAFPNHQVIAHRRPCIVPDVRAGYRHFEEDADRYHSRQIRSWLGVPLLYREQVIGMIALDSNRPGFYTDHSAALAMTFANQVATAITNARLFAEEQRRVKELDRVFQASQAIASSLDLGAVLRKIVSLAGDVAGSDHTGVVLLGEDGELVTSVEDHEVEAPLHRRARPAGVTRWVIQNQVSKFYEDVREDPDRHNAVVVGHGFRSYGGVPVVARDEVQGVLFVHSYEPDAFRGREPLLRTFCNQAAIAIENARLFGEAQQQADSLAGLVEASQQLIQHRSLDEVLTFCVQTGATLFDVEDCSIYVRSEERQTVDLVASSGIPADVWGRREALLHGPGLTAYVARTGETLNFGGKAFMAHPAWAGRVEEPFTDHLAHLPSRRCQSLLLGPLRDSRGGCVGVLKLENRRAEGANKCFSDFQVAMHKTLASQIGIAIERAGLYQRLDEEAKREARESLSGDLHDIMNVLHGALVLGVAYARELMATHDYVALQDQLRHVAKSARHVHEGIGRIHADVRDPVLQEKGLVQALKHYADMLQLPCRFHATGRTRLSADVEYGLCRIAQEALNNAARHACLADTGGGVEVVLQRSPTDIQLVVSDAGVGFDTAAMLHRSDAFGFQYMERWAKAIGAQLEVDSEVGRGTRVQVSGALRGDSAR